MRLLFIIILISTNCIFPQVTSSASASVVAIVPLSIQIINSDLNFGEIILSGSPANKTIAPSLGAQFLIEGHPNRSVFITYSTTNLNNNVWVGTYGGSIGQLTYSPNVQTDTGTPIVSGNSYTLTGGFFSGNLNVQLGGTLNIPASQPQGDYVGSFNITVSY